MKVTGLHIIHLNSRKTNGTDKGRLKRRMSVLNVDPMLGVMKAVMCGKPTVLTTSQKNIPASHIKKQSKTRDKTSKHRGSVGSPTN